MQAWVDFSLRLCWVQHFFSASDQKLDSRINFFILFGLGFLKRVFSEKLDF